MKLRILSFSDQGEALAKKLAGLLGGSEDRGIPAAKWTERCFGEAEALIFIGAAGIAVRSIAPFLKKKDLDPAVVVLDEGGRFVIPILSGHLGGANDLARRIGELTGAIPVITTATDLSGKFAVDEWARRQNFALLEAERILPVSSRILRGEEVRIISDWAIGGECPPGLRLEIPVGSPGCALGTGHAGEAVHAADQSPGYGLKPGKPDSEYVPAAGESPGDGSVRLSLRTDTSGALHLVPRIGVLGIGCRRGVSGEVIEGVFQSFLERERFYGSCITEAASIDRKAGEMGLLAFCRAHQWKMRTFSAGELAALPGEFSSSAFVGKTVGVDNVCERAAVLGSGGVLIFKKFAKNGVTMALAARPFSPDWRWRYERSESSRVPSK
ncbi:MAG: cobalamin biosynthesis protein [Lachnospiraceae bacterium]|nr:cobalamin biosynthesis protein [Lachnospiraceae bacterium]